MRTMKNKPFYMNAAFQFDALPDDSALPGKFSGVAYSGGSVNDWGEVIVIDLASTTVAPSMPLLFQHDHANIIGAISSSANTGATLAVSGELFSDIDETAAAVAAKSKRGVCYQMSVGIFDCSREDIPAGKSVVINGQTFTSPLTVLRNGNVREVSVVALGADAHTSANFFNQKQEPIVKETTSMELEQLQGQITELQAALAVKTAEADAATAQLAAQATESRSNEVKSLFAACGEEFSETTAEPFNNLTAEQFSAVSASMQKLAVKAQALPAGLFSQQVTTGAEQESTTNKTLSLTDIYALRATQAKGV